MNDAKVPFFDLGALVAGYEDELHSAFDEVLRSGYFVGGGVVERFEHEWAAYVGTSDCIGVGNGLDAIRLILEAYGIGPGDEVIVPAFTYYATWLAVQQVGATLVPVDVDRHTAGIDVAAAASAITPSTRAILAVHLFGTPVDLATLRRLADDSGVLLIEDAAQAHGAVADGVRVGAGGHAAAFSFYPTKNLGALGDAGGVTTSDAAVAARIRSRRSYGQGESKYDHVDTGWNTRLDPIQASILSLHLTKLDAWLERRRAIATVYFDALDDRSTGVVGPRNVAGSVWHHFVLRAADRGALRSQLGDLGIDTDVHYPYEIGGVAPLRSLVRRAGDIEVPHAAELAASVVSLPMGPWMSDDQVDRVATALRKIPAGSLLA